MVKIKTQFICSSCGAVSERWQGKCRECGEWNTLTETQLNSSKKSGFIGISQKPELLTDAANENLKRMPAGIGEFDRVVGGGIVPGSLVLLGGDPGIGKSTLVIQVASKISDKQRVLYVSGEESVKQVSLRANRLGINSGNLFILSETNVDAIIGQISSEKPAFVIIDSIQTMYSEDVMGASGSISQVSLCSQKLMETAKKEHVAILLIGHVTKGGNLAGPRLLEHLVDVVLYLEGDRYGGFRILRGIKNRFGSTNETGIFEMTADGMTEVVNPSKILLSERLESASGTAIFATMEGTRPLLVEIQALTSITSFGYPKRTVSGMDLNRLNLLLAVLTKRAGLNLSNQDVFVNVVGGMTIREPALDLGVALAIVSAYKNRAIKKDMAVFGEIGLAGEIRNVDNVEERIKEIEKLGFKSVLIPKSSKVNKDRKRNIKLIPVSSLKEAISVSLK
ncbi:DNA repair protein RadA [candidate division WS5 bacterium]|uniref:DNA repair protein RadA n=1 Tax=candidate division WS5 bacterium TaxID=2093353 RepID=A0A419DAA6_9BACT|nr:MAG: DNA repair protein RadA [candidate division WS5 bacterium]